MMKRLRKISSLLLLSLCLISAYPTMEVNATSSTEAEVTEDMTTGVTDSNGSTVISDTGDALQDILDESTYQGAISSISWFTERVDSITVMFVSAAAFFIICAAFLKNVCAGVYCANSKFFDKVDDAHKKKEALSIAQIKGYFSGGQFQNTSYGAFRDSFLALIPNFKAFTDFEDADIEPKQYFMKSIPEMCFCVIIGMFIYNGYYRDTAMLVGEFGSEAFVRVTSVADPVALLDKLSSTTGMPPLATDGMTDPAGKLANQITKDAYRSIIGRYSDMTTDVAKVALVSKLEPDIISLVNSNFVNGADAPLRSSGGNSWEAKGVEVDFTPTRVTDMTPAEGAPSGSDGYWVAWNDDVRTFVWYSSQEVAVAYGLQPYTTKSEEYPGYLKVMVNFKAVPFDSSKNGSEVSGATNGEEVIEDANKTAVINIAMVQEADGTFYCRSLPAKTTEGYAINWGYVNSVGVKLPNSGIEFIRESTGSGPIAKALSSNANTGSNVFTMSSSDDTIKIVNGGKSYIPEFHVQWNTNTSININ